MEAAASVRGFTIAFQFLGGANRTLSKALSSHRRRLSITEQTFPGCILKLVDKERNECLFDLIMHYVSMYIGGELNVEINSIGWPCSEQIYPVWAMIFQI